MTGIPAFEREPYRRRLETRVVEVGRDDDGRSYALLADTILYPEGGGQPADRGTIADVAVVDVTRTGGEIRHWLAEGEGLEPGEATVELDWARRFDHMQQHTAQHVLTAVAVERLGWATTSFHLGSDRSDVELDVAEIGEADLESLEEAVAEVIRQAVPVRAHRVSQARYEELLQAPAGVFMVAGRPPAALRSRGLPEGHRGQVRLVEIEGIDLNPCGGTHLATTAEIETVKLLDTEALRGGTRLHWLAGGRVRRRLAEREARAAELRRLLGAADEEMPGLVASRTERLQDEARRVRRLQERLAELEAARLVAAGERLVEAHFDDADGTFLQGVGRRLVEAAPARVGLLTASGGAGPLLVVVAGPDSGLDAQEAGAEAAAILDGRGGGRGPVFQGRAGSLDRREEALESLSRRLAEGRT